MELSLRKKFQLPIRAKLGHNKYMSIDVRIPTILRPFTKDQKAVTATGTTLSAVISDLDAQYPGIGDRLLENGALRRFINIYVNDEDVRFLGSLEAQIKDGDSVTILPAVAGG